MPPELDVGRLASAFVSLTDTLFDDFDAVDLFYELIAICVDVLDASAAGLLLASDDGSLEVAAASSESVRMLELFQVQNQEGPCLDCFPIRLPGAHRTSRRFGNPLAPVRPSRLRAGLRAGASAADAAEGAGDRRAEPAG
jgi:hypothetical protein